MVLLEDLKQLVLSEQNLKEFFLDCLEIVKLRELQKVILLIKSTMKAKLFSLRKLIQRQVLLRSSLKT